MIKVLLVDDHQIMLDGLSMLLDQEEDIEKVDEVLDGELALKALEVKEVDVVVLDIEMPHMDGIETTRVIKEQYPQVKILILTMYDRKKYIQELLKAGVSGYILKDRGSEELVKAIRKVAEGGKYVAESVTNTLIQSMTEPDEIPDNVRFTGREMEVLKLLAEGLTSLQIADQLFIEPTTVNTHKRSMMDKASVPNSNALIRYASQHNLLE